LWLLLAEENIGRRESFIVGQKKEEEKKGVQVGISVGAHSGESSSVDMSTPRGRRLDAVVPS